MAPKGYCPLCGGSNRCALCGRKTCDRDGCGREDHECDPADVDRLRRQKDARAENDDAEPRIAEAWDDAVGVRLGDGFRMLEGEPPEWNHPRTYGADLRQNRHNLPRPPRR